MTDASGRVVQVGGGGRVWPGLDDVLCAWDVAVTWHVIAESPLSGLTEDQWRALPERLWETADAVMAREVDDDYIRTERTAAVGWWRVVLAEYCIRTGDDPNRVMAAVRSMSRWVGHDEVW